MEFLRLGYLNPVKQDRKSPAPARRGLWCFPAPHMDRFFTCHRWDDLVPKRLTYDLISEVIPENFRELPDQERVELGAKYDALNEERRRWIKDALRRNVMNVKHFRYEGWLYAHIGVDGRTRWRPGEREKYAYAPYYAQDWVEIHTGDLRKAVSRSLAGSKNYLYDGKWVPNTMIGDVDHLEVFIPA
jgi:hypothetical protein